MGPEQFTNEEQVDTKEELTEKLDKPDEKLFSAETMRMLGSEYIKFTGIEKIDNTHREEVARILQGIEDKIPKGTSQAYAMEAMAYISGYDPKTTILETIKIISSMLPSAKK